MDDGFGNTKLMCDASHGLPIKQGLDLAHLLVCQFGQPMTLTSVVGVMGQFVFGVLFRCCPDQVIWGDAGIKAVAAGVAGFMLRCWRWAVYPSTHQAMCSCVFTFIPQFGVSLAHAAVRPYKTIRAMMVTGLEQKLQRCAIGDTGSGFTHRILHSSVQL